LCPARGFENGHSLWYKPSTYFSYARTAMKSIKRKKISLGKRDRLSNLEDQVAKKGVHIHYDVLEAAGLKLKGGICKINGEYHLFVVPERPV
jgi:hypothetical protein